MRHRVVRNKLASDKDHMRSLLNNLSTELILHEKIETTLAKAKALRPHIEKMVTKATKALKANDKLKKFSAIKALNSKVHDGNATRKLLEDIAGRFMNTPGGYTRIVRIGNRDGDKAEMARIEFAKTAATKALKKASTKKAVKEVNVESEKKENE